MVIEMYGIFMESVVIFKNYAGTGFLMVLFLTSVFYLAFKEKDKRLRVFFVWLPLIVLFLFFNPLFRKAFVRLDRETYYRLLWIIPMGVTIAYGGVKVFSKYRKTGLAVMTLLIVVCGRYVYQGQYVTKAENAYHIPQEVIEICDRIAPAEGEERIWAAFPSDLVHFVRQYNTDIQMPFGRDMIVPAWDYYNEVYEVMEKPDTVDARRLLEVTRKNNCSYVILKQDRELTEDPEVCGYRLIDTIAGYRIYEDPEVVEAMRLWQRQLDEQRAAESGGR